MAWKYKKWIRKNEQFDIKFMWVSKIRKWDKRTVFKWEFIKIGRKVCFNIWKFELWKKYKIRLQFLITYSIMSNFNKKTIKATLNTSGTSSAAIRTDRGGGTVTVNKGTYTTTGKGSPTIYSTADIKVSDATLILMVINYM